MTTSRLFILLAVLLGGLSAIYLLPHQTDIEQPAGVALELPKMVGGSWYGRDLKVSDKEHNVLGPDTLFTRKSYTDARGNEIQASVVLSGRDMNTSLHRPEWCLPAQGWTIAQSGKTALFLPEKGSFQTTRLFNQRLLRNAESGAPVLGKDGTPITIRNLDYYWFVGYTHTTASHFQRNCIDIGDRLVHGYNQRWAFVTVMSTVTEDLRPDGLSIAQTDQMIQDFIKRLVPLIQKDTVQIN